MSHSKEGRLLLGQRSLATDARRMGLRAADRQIVRKTTMWASAVHRARPAARSDLWAGQVRVDLPGHVALEDPDDLLLGSALLEAALHVGLGPWSLRSRVITMPHRALFA